MTRISGLQFRLTLCLLGALLASGQLSANQPTSGAVAMANLEAAIQRQETGPEAIELLLALYQFSGDITALDRAMRLAERPATTPAQWLSRAQVKAAAHQFSGALHAIATAENLGATPDQVLRTRAPAMLAIGRGEAMIDSVRARAFQERDYRWLSLLASFEAEQGQFSAADSHYQAALSSLDTTSPFPYAWIAFVRGLMWSEQANDGVQGRYYYKEALRYLPGFQIAALHLAEIEVAEGELESAEQRLQAVAAAQSDPESLALLADIAIRRGQQALGAERLERARRLFEARLTAYPLAFADHAARFYLGPAANPELALQWALRNLENRPTLRSQELVRAAVQGVSACSCAKARQAASES